MLNALKAEILAKRKELEDKNLISNEKKYFKRSELERVSVVVSEDTSESENTSKNTKNEGTFDLDDHMLPRTEVIRRLRDRREPVLLFNETFTEAFCRLRQLEIVEPEINRGFRNDFQEALEKVDKAYLDEILMTSKPHSSSKDANIALENKVTLESLLELAKNLPAASSVEANCKIVLHFVMLILEMWGGDLDGRQQAEKVSMRGKIEAATYSQTRSYLKPLMKRLRKNSLPDDILDSLAEIVCHCLDRHYVKSNDAYLQMAIGNAPWPIGVTMVGIHARTGREKIFSKHVAHVLNDETQRKYIQGLKRLITKCQYYLPTSPSRSVEYQAPPHS